MNIYITYKYSKFERLPIPEEISVILLLFKYLKYIYISNK